ncbi:hypothetical protein Tco_0322179 [Tanacetum coccineum]
MVIESEILYDFSRFFGVLIAKLVAGGAVNFTLKMKRDMIIENLDLEPKIDAMMREFLNSSQWEKSSKETSSEILLSRGRSRGKTFKPIASLIVKGKLK